MKLYPAIDIKNGQCVRLRQGQFQDILVYSNSPAKIAKLWESQGASFIHIVDLDGALVGHSVNEEAIREIVASVNIPVQVGGGIRSIKDIDNKLSLGVSRVIIGTKAVESSAFIKEAISTFGADKIVIGIDAKNGMVAIEGWEKVSNYNAVTLGIQMKEIGVKTIVYTDISKDGMLQGPNLEHTREMVEATGLDIIASGGVSSLKDLEMLDDISVHGAIIGKALYENRIELKNAVELFEKGE
ncbi:1-(5-phosphoribosyl)-5-[(5-phosphoribosylamino)methylideneamino]imidazole-4-carboxamide isomerase [Anaeromicropila herbilytica]|uniref:1-(5-phosphoribosyl)-5-[(5-phosphoribosylamino)methylideneamino] imidazole-4-carboxamide isomerase n=1 Tax=Anaeromicropila herbilytica TaxID=2785025 RepID=A0A7R7EKQ6_9FIRM|nr:1-(5-phosphoribosyl)-5-[(5-phosphoribosylamino)methylideneamino]imidazole-4-carboxamide isomerase [Anaeromicropila herbilytica]BCN30553.1 1-(5-phosphoribosyl)-5-[(5-phosphoribosylamino) me thylideneamino] imidazole-4-carboxamide isomerase [Anaeromicropila herbilytica]